eukprot:9330818-Heterocapsa_arctica.AAC.1
MQEEHPTAFPRAAVQDFWEELHWRFWEELKETLRQLKREVGRENLRRSDIALYALTPGADGAAWLRLPNVFDLHDQRG